MEIDVVLNVDEKQARHWMVVVQDFVVEATHVQCSRDSAAS